MKILRKTALLLSLITMIGISNTSCSKEEPLLPPDQEEEQLPVPDEGEEDIIVEEKFQMTLENMRTVMKEFYDATGGTGWNMQPNWFEEDDFHKWKFIEIYRQTVNIDLSGNNLVGTLPASFFELPLYVVNLSYNNLSGTLPANVGKNGYLVDLDIQENNLTGNFPEAMKNSSIYRINAAKNKMSGKLDPFFKDIYEIETSSFNPQQSGFGFTDADIVGPGDKDINTLLKIYGRLPESVKIELLWDRTKPKNWQRVRWNGNGRCIALDLECLYLENVPVELAQLDGLKDLSLAKNSLRQLPVLKGLNELTNLNLSENRIGTLDEELFKLPKLRQLDISNNDLSGQIPEKFNQMKQLKSLWLGSNNWEGKFTDLSGMPKLRMLEACHLEKLDAQPFPEFLVNCPELSELGLADGNFTGELTEYIPEMSKFTTIDLSGNKFSGELKAVFDHCRLHALTRLDLSRNLFSGELPLFQGMAHLYHLDLSNNSFTGCLPKAWSELSQLSTCYVNDNLLTGNIPEVYFNLSQLETFDCQMNRMRGTVPEKLKDHEFFTLWKFRKQAGERTLEIPE